MRLAEAQDARAAFHAELYWIHFWTMQGKRLLNREAQPWFYQRQLGVACAVRTSSLCATIFVRIAHATAFRLRCMSVRISCRLV
ncbi:MAG: hypothetical protein HY268_09685 [Deltaproteobacteria bacterium]|nr:hypothetical protein [Deltaproteobacteria bacterium]